jgi:DNA polymerase-3 subunit epsilon
MEDRVVPQKLAEAASILRQIHELIQPDRPLCFLDVEATGQFPDVDRIVEIYQLKAMQIDGEFHYYSGHFIVNPSVRVSPEVTEIHKLSYEDIVTQGIPFKDIVDGVWQTMMGTILVGYNLPAFDIPILKKEFAREGKSYNIEFLPVIDSYRIWQFMRRRTLADAYEEFVGEKFEDAHRASDDVFGTIKILAGQLKKFDELPKTAAGLIDFCLGLKDTFVDSEGKFQWREDEAICAFGNKNKGRSLQWILSNDKGYLLWILRSEFKPDLKQIIRNAFNGVFPVRPAPQQGVSPE